MVQRRALRYARNIDKGTIIEANDIIAVRPFSEDGIPPYKINELISKRLTKDVQSDDLVKWRHF